MSEWKMKRFWREVSVPQVAGGYGIALDDKPIRTPAKAPLVAPTRALGDAIAAEWEAQEDAVDPGAMPMTRAANSAIDKVAPQKDAVVAMLAEYGATDLLSYRADAPEALVEAQKSGWNPMLDWADRTYGARLRTTSGVMPITQDPEALMRLSAPLDRLSAFELTAAHDLIALSGSLVLGLAVLDGGYDPDAVWTLSRVDEDWQAGEWGADEEAAEAAARKRGDFLSANRFLTLLREDG